MSILNIDLKINNLKINISFDEDDPDTIIHIRLFAWRIKFEKRKVL